MMAPAAPAGGAPAAAAGAPAEEAAPAAEKTHFTIKLEKFDAASKIKLIKEVRAYTGLGLKEAKELVEKAPTEIRADVAKEEVRAHLINAPAPPRWHTAAPPAQPLSRRARCAVRVAGGSLTVGVCAHSCVAQAEEVKAKLEGVGGTIVLD